METFGTIYPEDFDIESEFDYGDAIFFTNDLMFDFVHNDRSENDQDSSGKQDSSDKGKEVKEETSDKPSVPNKKELIDLEKLPAEKQIEIEHICELQDLILFFSAKLKFPNDKEKKEFYEKLKKEMGSPIEEEPHKFSHLPEFGETTKEGFRRIKDFLEKGQLPDLANELNRQMLQFPPGFPLKIAGKQETVFKSAEQLRQELMQGKGYLDIDATKLEDVAKLNRVSDWVNAAEKSLHDNHIERLERYLSKKVEEGISAGKFPSGWRRQTEMDAETWCAAIEEAMNIYTRVTHVVEAVDYLNKSGTGLKIEALDKLPHGIKITRDDSNHITRIEFGDMMIPDIKLQGDENRKKLDVLMSWCDKFESKAQQALGEALKESTNVAGYGECAVSDGWVNPDTREFVMGSKPPGSDWKKFNLFSYDLDITEERDAFGKVSKVYVSADVGFQEVPPYGYLNTCGKDVFRTRSDKPVEYKPEDYVAVQTAPGHIDMIKAKDLSDWKTRQQLKHYGEKAITFTMDAAMVVSGIGELTAAARVAQLGAEEAVAIGGQILKTEATAQLPKGIAAGMVRRGLIEMTLGLTGVFHNAGAHEVPWMQAVSAVRSIYFLLHAGYSVAELFRIPKAAAALGEALSPKLMETLKGIVTSITGTERTLLAAQMARAGAMESLQALKAADSLTHAAFYVSEKAFIGMFLWHAVGMVHKYQEPYRQNALKTARNHLLEANITCAGS